jgi:regulatory protein
VAGWATLGKQPLSLKASAIRLLARREYARAELHDRLVARGATREEVERVLDELERSGYLSDVRFAQALVAQKAGRYGKRAIAHQLRQKQVAPVAAIDALASMALTDAVADATALWQRRFGDLPKDDREKARQVRFLQARGYSITIALKVLRHVATGDGAVE